MRSGDPGRVGLLLDPGKVVGVAVDDGPRGQGVPAAPRGPDDGNRG